NDLHGHPVGDLLLVEVGNRLQASVRQMDTVARFGGDEFVVLLGELGTDPAQAAQQACAVAEKIRERLAEPYALLAVQEDGTTREVVHRCTASIGLVVFSGKHALQSEVLDAADVAMYQAKEAGRNRVSVGSVGPPAEPGV
ncbi:MAG: GGDEF domain-containing protein, partial [Burkholderiaceae bacterium]|nr:GGDEF domain-containing protein [Burkholderiaceae bacterium]